MFQDVISENYKSAEESSVDIRRQVKEDLEAGTVIRLSEAEAERRYRGRLAVAALGAVPKEINSVRVRLIHDGSYSVDVKRIRVRDRMRFPLVDDAAAVLASVEEDMVDEDSKIRFAMVSPRPTGLSPFVNKIGAFKQPGFPGLGRAEKRKATSMSIPAEPSASHQRLTGGGGVHPLW